MRAAHLLHPTQSRSQGQRRDADAALRRLCSGYHSNANASSHEPEATKAAGKQCPARMPAGAADNRSKYGRIATEVDRPPTGSASG